MSFAPLPKELADDFFDRDFPHVDIADVACLEEFSANLSDLRPRHFQLHRHGRLFQDFAKNGEIARDRPVESKVEDLVARKTIDDLIERSIKEDFSVIDHQDAMTQLLDVLHVMAG